MLIGAARGVNGLLQTVVEQAAVGQVGEWIEKREAINLFFIAALLANIANYTYKGDFIGTQYFGHRQTHGEYFAVFTLAFLFSQHNEHVYILAFVVAF